MSVPVTTVTQATSAMPVTPACNRTIRSRSPARVTQAGVRLHRPASPPPNASKNRAPKIMPCAAVHVSRLVSSIRSSVLLPEYVATNGCCKGRKAPHLRPTSTAETLVLRPYAHLLREVGRRPAGHSLFPTISYSLARSLCLCPESP